MREFKIPAIEIVLLSDYLTDGLSLTPLFEESGTNWRKSLYMGIVCTRAIVTNDFKYIAVRFPKDIQKLVTESNRREFTQEGVWLKPEGKVRHRIAISFPGYFDDDQLYDFKSN